jgi:DNA-binding protein H-NS
MADLPETLESIVRRTRSYIQLLKQENSDLLEWQQEALSVLQDARDQLHADGHDELVNKLNDLVMRAAP